MKKLFSIVAILVMLLSASCTQNDGRIGPIFGTWHLESITCSDGSALPDSVCEPGNMAWMFQNDVICMRDFGAVGGVYVDYWGSFRLCERNGERRLILDYTHSDAENSGGTGIYGLPDSIGLPSAPATFAMRIMHLDGSRMVLCGPEDADATLFFVYNFTKLK